MLILAFDTATPAVTVALCWQTPGWQTPGWQTPGWQTPAPHGDRRVLARESAVDARRHGELLAPAIEAVLTAAGATAADLTSIAVGTGPGPYTGLRAGLVTAQVLGATLGIDVDGICTLDVIAAEAKASAAGLDFIVATDARRSEVYWARYSATGERLTEPAVSLPAELPAGYPVAGEGPLRYPGFASEVLAPRYPDAAVLADLAASRVAKGTPPAPALPLYLRRPDAKEPGRPKRVTPAGQARR